MKNKLLIAALKRCATQSQGFSATSKAAIDITALRARVNSSTPTGQKRAAWGPGAAPPETRVFQQPARSRIVAILVSKGKNVHRSFCTRRPETGKNVAAGGGKTQLSPRGQAMLKIISKAESRAISWYCFAKSLPGEELASALFAYSFCNLELRAVPA